MPETKTTRLRYILASDPEQIALVLNGLGFKVEIKGGPVQTKKGWALFFVIPDAVKEWPRGGGMGVNVGDL